MDIKLETLRYNFVIFGGDFFTIDFFTVKSGPFVIQNHNTSFEIDLFNEYGLEIPLGIIGLNSSYNYLII